MCNTDHIFVVFFIQDLYKLGAQFATAKLANSLSANGYRVEVVVSAIHADISKNRPDLQAYELSPDIGLACLPNKKASLNFVSILRYLRDKEPDIIVATSENYLIPIALGMYLTNRRSRLIFVEHSSGIGMKDAGVEFRTGDINYHESFMRTITRALLWPLLKYRIDNIVAVSSGVKDALIESRGVDSMKISVIPNPVLDSEFFLNDQIGSNHPWLIYKTLPVIVAAGAHVPFKAFDVLIKGFVTVRSQHPCRLIIFGEGPLTDSLKSLAIALGVDADIDFPGFTANLPAELRRADCFVVSSNVESFSIVLVQALACKVPVVATDCPSGPREILRGGKYGILTRTGDSDDLAAGIARVLEGGGISPPDESWEPYRSEIVCKQFESLFRRDARVFHS